MKTLLPKLDPSELPLTLQEFLKAYNSSIPKGFPKATLLLLQKYRDGHKSFFKHEGLWSLADHRKRIMDWLQLNQVLL